MAWGWGGCVAGQRCWPLAVATGGCHGAPKDRSSQPGSVRTHPTEVRGRAGWRPPWRAAQGAIVRWRALSEVVPFERTEPLQATRPSSDLTANGATTESSRRPDSCRRTARMGANGYPQPSRRTADLRGGAPRRKKRIAQPHRCVEVSKTRKSAHINTGVCDFLAWLPKPKTRLGPDRPPTPTAEDRQRPLESSPGHLQTTALQKTAQKVAHRAPHHHKSIPRVYTTSRHHKHTSITLKKLNARLVARRRPDRRPWRPRSREIPSPGRRRHAPAFRLVVLIVGEPRRR